MALDEKRLTRLLELGRSLVGDLDLEAVLNRVLDAARELTGARYAALGILDDDREELAQFLTVGVDEATHRAIGDLPRGRGVLGVLIREPKPLRLRAVGDHPQSYGFPVGHPPMESFLGVPIRIRGEAFGNLYLTDKEGAKEFSEADEETLIALADWAAIAIGNARRHVGVRGQRDELARAVEAFETAEAINKALAGETELSRILELVAKRSRALVNARAMVVALREGDDLVVRAASGDVDRSLLGLAYPVKGSFSGQALLAGRPQRLSEAAPGVRAPLQKAFGARTSLVVPLRFRGEGLGVLAALDRGEGEEFTDEDERLMSAFASSAATAVATARDVAAQGLRKSIEAAERERSHWARELHDQTLQDLAALKVMLGGARRQPSREQLDRGLEQALEQIQHTISSLRGLITELRPAALDELGLAPALQTLAERLQLISGLQIVTKAELDWEEQRLTPALENTAYRIVQEALSNAIKHSRAAHAYVDVHEEAGCIVATVTDDGAGFDVSASGEGFGLVGMRERVALLGGEIDISSTLGKGTVVTARLPVERRASADVVELAPRSASAG